MNIVLDTNVLVSALWSPWRKPGEIVGAAIAGHFDICYDFRIVEEYERVLRYPKFGFADWEIAALLEPLLRQGVSVAARPLPEVPFTDESDRKFYEVARFCRVPLVTGNLAHFPGEDWIMSVAAFYDTYVKGGV